MTGGALEFVDAEVNIVPEPWCAPDFRPPPGEAAARRLIYDHPDRDLALSRAGIPALRREMKRTGISAALIMSLPWTDVAMCWESNAVVSEAARPGDFFGVGTLPHPRREDPRQAVRRLQDEFGFSAIRVIPSWYGLRVDDDAWTPAYREILDRGMVLYAHTSHFYMPPEAGDPPFALFALLKQWPDLRVIAGHLGGLLCLYALHEPLRPLFRNVLFAAGTPSTMKMTEFARDAVGAENLAFSTDFPFNAHHDQASVKQAFEALSLSAEERRLIAGVNIRRFLGWAS